MLNKPPECQGCELLLAGSSGFMNPEGTGSIGVALIGEALGEYEAADGLPFRPHAPAGAVLERTIKCAGMDRQQFMVTNCCHCRPPRNLLENQPYEVGALNHCQVYMRREVERFQPKVMVAMGGIALRMLTGYTGKKRTITNVRGFYLDNVLYPGIPVISTYHSAYVARDKPNLLGVLRLDILRAVELARRGGMGGFTRPSKRYTIFPPIDVAQRFLAYCRANPDLPICYDIETEESISRTDESELTGLAGGSLLVTKLHEEYQDTPEHLLPTEEGDYKTEESFATTKITQIQFSLRPFEAIVLAFQGDFLPIIRQILSLPNPKWSWNGYAFDQPILAAAGVVISGLHVDWMWGWHHLQPDLPRGLQYACSFFIPEALPWKHLSNSDPGEYGGDDVAYLRQFGGDIENDLRKRGLWEGFERHVLRLHPILVDTAARGIPISEPARAALGEYVDNAKAGAVAELQEIVPLELRNIEPKQGYANPKIAEKRKAQVGGGLGDGEQWGEREFTDSKTGVLVKRWCRILPFLPNSGQQILRYIKWRRAKEIEEKVRGYRGTRRYAETPEAELIAMAERNAVWKVPKEFRTDKETTAKKELERLGARTGDRFFGLVVESREYTKIRAAYVNGWAPAADGRVHTRFSFAAATGQLSGVKPNTMTMPKPGGEETAGEARRTMLAQLCRGMVVAPPGHKIILIDKRSFHAMTLGFNARDPVYMRVARLDIHSFVTANFMWMNERSAFLAPELGLAPNPESWLDRYSDEELRELLGRVKKQWKAIRDKKAKPCILGIGLGLGDNKCFEMNKRDELNPRGFDSIGEVRKFKNVLKGLFDAIFKYHNAIREQAHRQAFLKTRYQFIRWFFDVYHYAMRRGNWVQEPGKDSEAAIALYPQNDAHGMIKDEILAMEAEGLLERYGFMNVVHDEVQFCCPDELTEECLYRIPEIMRRPCKVLTDPVVAPEGLVVDVEAAIGQSWREAKGVKV